MRHIMFRKILWSLVLLTLVVSGVRSEPTEPADDLSPRVAPIYALPNDGSWVEFAITYRDRQDREFNGKMWISSVGQGKNKEGDPSRWVEIKIQGEPFEIRYGKMLVTEKAFTKGHALEESVSDAFHQEGVKGPILRMTRKQITEYFSMGVRGELEFVKDVEVKTKLGNFKCRQMLANGKGRQRPAKTQKGEDQKEDNDKGKVPPAEQRDLEYRAWLADDVPFGVVRFEVWAKTKDAPPRMVYSAEVIRRGEGAKSEVDERNASSK